VAVPAKRGRGEVAVGNIVGTIVHFIAFNAGVIALVRPLELDDATLGLHLPVAAGSVLLVASLFIFRSRISHWEGAVLLALYVAYIPTAVVQVL
jgi:cation:H+ antiporter